MNKKKLLPLGLISLLALAGCNAGGGNANGEDYSIIKDYNGQVLNIFNCADYISDGSEGYVDLIAKFQKQYNCVVNYNTYDTNETMYNQLEIQQKGTYDLICPSDYMIEKLIKEDKLEKLDQSKLTTYRENVSTEIANIFDNITVTKNDEEYKIGDYAVGYMWGTLGIIHDVDYISDEDASSWDVFWSKDHYKEASIKNSLRDTYVAGILHHYEDELLAAKETMTTEEYKEYVQEVFDKHSEEDVKDVREELTELKKNIYGFEVDSGKNDIIDGKIKMNLAWSGDAVYSIDTALKEGKNIDGEIGKILHYSVPEAGSNIWFDGWIMPKGIPSSHVDLAYEFMNFLSDEQNAADNMDYIGYTPFIATSSIFDVASEWYGAREYYEADSYYAENAEEEIDASIVHYTDEENPDNTGFYQCIQDVEYEDESDDSILPTNEEYFEKLSEEDSPLDEAVDLSFYFGDKLAEDYPGKSAVVYPYDEDSLNGLYAQYPSQEIINRCAIMHDFGAENANVVIMWSQVKASTNMIPYYVILGVTVALVPAYYLIRYIKEKNNMKYATKRKEK